MHIRAAAFLVIIAICGFGVRLLPSFADMYVLDSNAGPMPFPDDPPYHLLRLKRLATGTFNLSAEIGEPDPFIAHPYGETCIWPWGFDLVVGTTAPFIKVCGENCMIKVAGLIPPLLSIVSVLVLFWLCGLIAVRHKRDCFSQPGHGDGWFGVIAASIFALMPANVAYTLAGRVDHHVMEPLVLILALLPVFAAGRKTHAPGLMMTGGLICGLSGAFFPAAPALAIPLFMVVGTFEAFSRQASRIQHVLTWCGGMLVGTAVSLFFSPFPGQWVFYSASLTHVALVVCGTAALATCAAIFSWLNRAGRFNQGWTRYAVAGMSGTVGGLLTLLTASRLFPVFLTSILGGTSYTASEDLAKLSLEASSFLDSPVRVLELTGWLLPFSIVGMAGAAVGSRSAERRLISVLALIFISLAMMQRRFLVAATPFIALTAAEGLLLAAGRLHRQFERLAGKPVAPDAESRIGTIGAALMVMMLTPSLITDLQIEPLTARDRAMYSAATAIREIMKDQKAESGTTTRSDTPAPTGKPAPTGVLAPWGYGHLLKYGGGVPTVCDNFFGVPGSDAAIMRCLKIMYSNDDAFINRQFADLQIRFVVIVPPHPDQIRVETGLLGMDPSLWSDSDGRLTALFAQSFYGRTGMWASNAPVGQVGPWNLRLKGRFKQVDPETREVMSEVFLLEHVGQVDENLTKQTPTTDTTPQNH